MGDFRQAMAWLISEAERTTSRQRYKGLGEMNPDQRWDTTLNPETRTLLHVEIEDAMASSELFEMLMGEEVKPRATFIKENAHKVQNLDV